MATSVILNRPNGSIKKAKESGYANTSVDTVNYYSKVKDIQHSTKSVKSTSYPVTKVIENVSDVKISDFLPFRVKFTTIGIDGYSSTNPPPIGIAVIGYSNYIL